MFDLTQTKITPSPFPTRHFALIPEVSLNDVFQYSFDLYLEIKDSTLEFTSGEGQDTHSFGPVYFVFVDHFCIVSSLIRSVRIHGRNHAHRRNVTI